MKDFILNCHWGHSWWYIDCFSFSFLIFFLVLSTAYFKLGKFIFHLRKNMTKNSWTYIFSIFIAYKGFKSIYTSHHDETHYFYVTTQLHWKFPNSKFSVSTLKKKKKTTIWRDWSNCLPQINDSTYKKKKRRELFSMFKRLEQITFILKSQGFMASTSACPLLRS